MSISNAVRKTIWQHPELEHNMKLAYTQVCHVLGLATSEQVVNDGPNYETVARLVRRFRNGGKS